jgi:hypothetical protein
MHLSTVRVVFLVVSCLWVSACGHRSATARPTFRLLRDSRCNPCDIKVLAREAAGSDAVDCGWAREDAQREAAIACVRKAEAAGKPFHVGFDLAGIDSAIRTAFVRRADGSMSRFWYDSDPAGGGRKCAAVVSRRPCASFPPDPEEPTALTCEPAGTGHTVCNEEFSPDRNWGPPEDASDMQCRPDYDELVCVRKQGKAGNLPAGTALRCKAFPSGAFRCVKEDAPGLAGKP